MSITKRKPARLSCLGATLAETLVGICLAAILLVAVAIFGLYSSHSLAHLVNYVDMDQSSRLALDYMTREIRQATRIRSFQPTRLELVDYDGEALVYEYLPEQQALVRSKGDTRMQTLLTGCPSFSFGLFMQNPRAGTYDLLPTTDPNRSKVVSITWLCSRSLLGKIQSTEKVQSARIVIRKH